LDGLERSNAGRFPPPIPIHRLTTRDEGSACND
jgi:hypothetical protein